MLEYEEWNKLKTEVYNVLNMYAVTINLSTDNIEDKIEIKVRHDHKHFMGWSATKKVKFTTSSTYLFDADCITVNMELSDDGLISINVDERNSNICMSDYPELLSLEYKMSNPNAGSGEGLYTFKTKDIELLGVFMSLLSKHGGVIV